MKPKYEIGELITNRNGWQRSIVKILRPYGNGYSQTGYVYRDRLGQGVCSEEHLTRWRKKPLDSHGELL